MNRNKFIFIIGLILFGFFHAFGQLQKIETLTIEQCLKLANEKKNEGNARDASYYFNAAAEKYWEDKNFQKAVEIYNQSIKLNESISNLNGIAGIHCNLGLIYYDMGEFENSYNYFYKSYLYRKKNDEKHAIINQLINISVALNKVGRYDESVKALEEGVNVSRDLNDYEQMRSCYGMLSETYTKAGNFEKAADYFLMYKTVHDDILKASEKRHKSELNEATMRVQLAEIERELAETRKRWANYELAEISKAYEGLDSTNRALMDSKSKAELMIENLQNKEIIANFEKSKIEDKLAIEQAKSRSLIVGLGATLIGIIIIVYFFWQKRKDNLKLAQQRDQIDEQRMEIMASIRYAQTIQNAILPDINLEEEILSDSFVFFLPRDIVSGDYFWATRIGNKSIVAAADCTGHGVPGAFLSILGISFLDEIVLKHEIDTASKILDELRLSIKSILSKTEDHHDGMDISLCIIDYEAMEVQFAGAYNSLYLIRQGELIEYKADKMPVGMHILDYEKNFTNNTIPLIQNDMLYIFSDGYSDQFGGSKNAKFKTKQFKQLLIKISELPTNQQKDTLKEIHENWKGDGFQVDDILIIGIRINEPLNNNNNIQFLS